MTATRRVLVVEDEADIRETLSDVLEAGGSAIEVTPAASGLEALQLLPTARPHLILTDYKMPGMTGLEFLAAARDLAPGTPRILMTAFPDPEIRERADREAHVARFLPKPVDPVELLSEVERIFAEAGSLPRDPA